MDYSLVLGEDAQTRHQRGVLILVVMDYSLVQHTEKAQDEALKVLILVVMDYSLVPPVPGRTTWRYCSLNPCCNGL